MKVMCREHPDRVAVVFDLSKSGEEGLCEECWENKFKPKKTQVRR